MKRKLIFFLKLLARLAGALLLLLLLYLFFNANFIDRNKPLSAAELDAYCSRLDSTRSDPDAFIAAKFDDHDAVLIGEPHFRKQDAEFISHLITYLYNTRKIKYFGWEFGATELQSEVDSIVNAKSFDRTRAIAVMRRSLFFWNFEEYLQIFKTIWTINSACSDPRDRVRFVQLNRLYVEKRFQSPDPAVRIAERLSHDFDRTMAETVDTAVLQKHEKILIYCGLHHAFTRYRTPILFFIKNRDMRFGERLLAKYPGRVYMASLCFAPFDKWFLPRNLLGREESKTVYPFDGVFNQLYDRYRRPFAVDAADPVFGALRDHASWYAFDTWSGIRLKDFCDGYIVLNAFDAVEPVAYIPDWVSNDTDLAEVKSTLLPQYADSIQTAADLLRYSQQQVGRNNIRQWHALKKFWRKPTD